MMADSTDLRLHHAEDRIKRLQQRVLQLEEKSAVSEYAVCMLLVQSEYLLEILGRQTVLKGVKMTEVEARIREKNILSSFSTIAPENLKEVISNAKRAIQGRRLTVSDEDVFRETPKLDLSSDLFGDGDGVAGIVDPASGTKSDVIAEDDV